MSDLIVIRYGEMTLKKGNYKFFLRLLEENIKSKLSNYKSLKFFYERLRFYISLGEEDYNTIAKVLKCIPGIHSFAYAKMVEYDLNEVENTLDKTFEKVVIVCVNILNNIKYESFKIDTNRVNKLIAYTSIQISQEVSRKILPKLNNTKVDVHNPSIKIILDFRKEGVFISSGYELGMGGYPAGSASKALMMISGGIDSCVALYLSLKKGLKMSCIHFESYPFTSKLSFQKVIDLIQIQLKYTLREEMDLYVCSLYDLQNEINNKISNDYNVIILRRIMYKVASKLAIKYGFYAIINGESIGQVASQTLDSIKVVNDGISIPIIRPLATYDKDEIIHIARRINTYEISIRPYEDCCTVFVPQHPVINPKLDYVINEESKLNVDEIVEKVIENIQIIKLSSDEKYNVFKE